MSDNLFPQPEEGYNFVSAFALYCQGETLPVISESLGIPPSKLQEKVIEEDWATTRDHVLGNSMALTKVGPNGALMKPANKSETVRVNRLRNLQDVTRMRNHLLGILTKLQEGSLTFEKVMMSKGAVVRVDVGPTTSDLVNIANFAKIVAELSYRALGDHLPRDTQDLGPGSNQGGQSITIILPDVVSKPRNEREEKQAKVIDITPEPSEES